jgi:OOP family OmpA-OmpF porin
MKTIVMFIVAGFFILLQTRAVYSQDLLDKIKDQAEKKIEDAIEKDNDKEKKEKENQNKEETEKKAVENNNQAAESKSVQQDELKSYSKYDFIPGDNVIFYEDFSQDNIGEFPALWNTDKAGEVMTTNRYPGHWFKLRGDGSYWLEKTVSLPANCTFEFDVIPDDNGEAQYTLNFDFTLFEVSEGELYPRGYVPGRGGVDFNFSTFNGYNRITGYLDQEQGMTGEYEKENGMLLPKVLNHIAIWIQKTRVRVYIHGEKVFDLPKVLSAGIQLNQLRFWVDAVNEPLISNIRIAEAGADMRSKLLTEGKLVTHGILFDVNSDKIKPESYGTLKEIAKVLKDNPDVKVKIVGHTDSDGSDASNLDLSKRRALSVKNTLSKDFGIDVSRMETDGKGESEPIADNKTAEGKANNRRVEFIKI